MPGVVRRKWSVKPFCEHYFKVRLPGIAPVNHVSTKLLMTQAVCKKAYFMTLFSGWGSTAFRLEPLRGGSLLITIISRHFWGFLSLLMGDKTEWRVLSGEFDISTRPGKAR